jgi:hypothetical protein
MSGKNNHTTPYSAADIEKYLKGELPARDMHDLERAALEDPFLADAIEGLTLHATLEPPAPVGQDLTDLQERLSRRVSEDRRRPPLILRPLTLAAAVLLLLGIGYSFFFLFGRHTAVHVVRNETARGKPANATGLAKSADTAAVADSQPATAATAATGKPAAAATATTADSTALALASTPRNRESQPGRHNRLQTDYKKVARPATAATTDKSAAAGAPTSEATAVTSPATLDAIQPATATPKANNPATPNAASNAEVVTSTYIRDNKLAADLKKENFSKARKQDDSLQLSNGSKTLAPSNAVASNGYFSNAFSNQRVYAGKVLDQQNRPISGAYLALKNTNGSISTVTNQLGEFSIPTPPSDSIGQLTVSSVGYGQQSLALDNLSPDGRSNNIIRLSPQNTSLDEVVVIGYGSRRKETKVASPSGNGENLDSLWIQATPVVGRPAYLEYLASAKSKLGLDSALHGIETVSFVVNRNGTLNLFKIEQSISPAHDAAIIRLVTEGPAWLLRKGKMDRASVTVKF